MLEAKCMNARDIEHLAIKKADMPSDMSLPEMWLYLAFEELYCQFRNGSLTKEQGAAQKKKLLAAYELACFYYRGYIDTINLRQAISGQLTELERCGCDNCKKLIRLFEGRDKQYDRRKDGAK